MYQVSAELHQVQLHQIPLNEEFQINEIDLENPLLKRAKLLFICSPNNPSGNLMDFKSVEKILTTFQGIVLIDEAYIDFADASSWVQKLQLFPNLIVSQTFSKAYGLAAARVGVAYASTEIIPYFNKI
jgi:histidinol-phosphate aminotransferase